MSDVDLLQSKLGLPGAPVVRAGLTTAAYFFRMVIQQDPMTWWQYLRGIDFHHAVTSRMLPRGTPLVRFENLGDRRLKPFVYFTKPGTSPFSLGTSFAQTEFKVFETDGPTPALEAIASGLSFSPADRVSRLGGGVQFMVAFKDAPALVRVAKP